ncbi:MAG: AsmA family protein [gamma proteobacterium symbiont of Bathyaustriella thionipta]|nr:AsmA family protein [gamma proteobacterium symbiont of Bathyaustriella thionipta]MCU7949595.1 AsmA family protein [gamma proteobacterium symbiont of Bathyaustriella thionipta]MCU7953258.1 AsmA family protein [gamma proteobacterium symbiont of Bathyaustriella thionipta]MCU7956187.1 AsmA family protein [gamma proteobacterium symbiont of Bathyaustriella thionipta]MCU7968850.1 AsmA family protein [gamma proteobacterium symbiont of Bathyaustriella thionipta]
MKKLLKALIKIASVLIIIFVMISIGVALFVDINQYKTEITQLVEKETGLKLEIKGELRLSVFSGIKFNANDLKLWSDKELIADVESVSLGLTAYSLYLGKLEITSVDLSVRTLKISRDKKGQFNFLPLYNSTLADSSPKKSIANQTQEFSLNSLAIKNIQLSIEQFQYLDDLSSVSIKLTTSQASLSLLPVIDHHELVNDDPRVLVAYTYDGELAIKKALINQYQISNLALHFSDQKGDFIADQLSFGFLEEGMNHAPPPVMFDAQGKLIFKLRYHIPEGVSEPVWAQPELVKIGQFDFNLPQFKLSDKHYQIETEHTHLVFDEMSIFDAKQYLLNELLIKSLTADSRKVVIAPANNSENIAKYDFKQVHLALNNVPVIHQGKPLDVLSDVFLKKFANNAEIKLTSDTLQYKSQGVDNLNVALKGNVDKIDFLMSSSNVMNSSATAEGYLKVSPATQKESPQWQFKVLSDKLHLATFSELTNSAIKIEGISSIDTRFSGTYNDSKFHITNARVNTRADNVLLKGINLNKLLDDFQNSQRVGLLDVGAVVLMGPTGMLLTKGNDYNNLVKSLASKGNSKINQLSLNMSLSNNIVTMNDVAFSTQKHRIAAKGKINKDKQTFNNFTVATIDQQGCPIYAEAVQGTLSKPKIKKVNVVVSGIVNPISSLVKKVSKQLNIQCSEVFYNGVVKSPAQ